MFLWLFMVFLLLILPKIIMVVGEFFALTFAYLGVAIYEFIINIINFLKNKFKKE